MSVTPAGKHYDINKDPFFAALNRGSAKAPGAVAPEPGYKTYAQQEARIKVNVDNYLIDNAFYSLQYGPSVQPQNYAPGSNNALVQSIFQFGNELSAAAGQLAALGSKVNTRA